MKPEKNTKPLEDAALEKVNAGTDDGGVYRPLPDGKVITAAQPEEPVQAKPVPVIGP